MPNLEQIRKRWKSATILRARIWTSVIVILIFLIPTWLYVFGTIQNTNWVYVTGATQGVLWIISIVLLISIWQDKNENLFKI